MVRITDEFAHLGVVRGNLSMFRVNEALFLVNKCRERNIRILGIDAFIVNPNTIQPVMEDSPDWSDVEPIEKTWELAETFFKKHHNSDLYFEIVPDQDWAPIAECPKPDQKL